MLKRREDYTPPAFLVTAVDLNIDIHDLGSIVTTKLAVTPNPAAGGAGILHLDGRGLELQSISVDGNPWPILTIAMMNQDCRLPA